MNNIIDYIEAAKLAPYWNEQLAIVYGVTRTYQTLVQQMDVPGIPAAGELSTFVVNGAASR